MEGIHRKSYSEAVIEGVRKRGRVFVGVRAGTTAIVRKYRKLVRTLKQTRVEQVILSLSGILPVIGRRGHRYQNCRGMAINMLVQKLCREEEVGFVGKFCWKGGYIHEGWASTKWKGGSSICGWSLSSSRQWHG